MKRDKMIEELVKPDAPDEMAFVLRSSDPDPERGFSKEGLDTIVENIQTFIAARVLAAYERDGKMPKNLRAVVNLDWIGPPDEFLNYGPRPWFALDDKGETPLDGSHREQS
jgi:hypothetical protein